MRISISKFVWFDGKYITQEKANVPITTHAIHYGTSIFEGIRVYWNSKNLFIFRLDDHITRFRNSGKLYSISLNFSNSEIKSAIINLCVKNKIKEPCYIRPIYFVGEYGISLHITKSAPTHAAIFMFPLGDLFNKNGISVCISSWKKFDDSSVFTLAKMGGNYLNSILATQESKLNGYDEAILLDKEHNVSESSGENVFLVKDGQIFTAPISSSILDGITRNTIIELSHDMNNDVITRKITRSELYLADEVFLTGTAAEITPVIKIEDKVIGEGKIGSITKELMLRYKKIVINKDERYSKWITKVY